MVLSCSLRDFLSPLGMEIRLVLCKRIFHFSFSPLCYFFMFVVHSDLFGNLIWIFSLPDNNSFFSLLFAVTQNTDFIPWILTMETPGKNLFTRLEAGENHTKLLLSSGPVQQRFIFGKRPITEQLLQQHLNG